MKNMNVLQSCLALDATLMLSGIYLLAFGLPFIINCFENIKEIMLSDQEYADELRSSGQGEKGQPNSHLKTKNIKDNKNYLEKQKRKYLRIKRIIKYLPYGGILVTVIFSISFIALLVPYLFFSGMNRLELIGMGEILLVLGVALILVSSVIMFLHIHNEPKELIPKASA
jgi:hypothetical protein